MNPATLLVRLFFYFQILQLIFLQFLLALSLIWTVSGDTRVNQNPQLTLLQVVLLREHNRLADALAALNPHWDDETIFQEARRINIAEHQFISYYEWLPIFIGLENSLRNKILYNTKGFVNDYQPQVNPTVLNEHATAAFRYFHSLIAGYLEYDVMKIV